MDPILDKIIRMDAPPEERIDVELLNKYTRKESSEGIFKTTVRWNKVKHLYLLGNSSEIRKQVSPGTYFSPSSKWVLVVGISATDVIQKLVKCSSALKRLYISDSDIKELQLDIFKNDHISEQLFDLALDELFIGKNNKLSEFFLTINLTSLFILDILPKLHTLHIGHSKLRNIIISKVQPCITYLDAPFTELTNLDFMNMMPNLETVWLHGSQVRSIPSLSNLVHLDTLVLTSCPITSLDGVEFPPNFRRLHLDNTRISRLPDEIRNIQKLSYINLSGLELEDLPDWLPELGLTMGRGSINDINLANTTVNGVNMSIFDQPQEMILQWFEQRKSGGSRPLNELKVVFLGDGGAGKSHTIARLLENGEQSDNFPNSSTPGIVIQDKSYDIDGRNIQIHFWDFGGQDILHSMHHMFLTDRTLYVVMVNVRDGTQTERARHWLYSLRSFAAGAPVLLVLNQLDTNQNADVNMPELQAMYPALTEDVKMSALKDTPESIQNNLIAALKRQIGAFETLESPFLPAWSKLMELLRKMPDYYIKGDQFEQYCADCGVEDSEEIRLALLRWFSDLGVSFHYGTSKLKDFVILRPDWITNAIYTIIFNKSNDVDNGLISHDAIYDLLRSKSPEVRRAIPDLVYKKEEIDYVLDVIRKFRLSFRVGDDTEFIPTLCQASSLPIAVAYENDATTLEFRMEYEYLPNNVLHRLMVDMRRDLDTNQVWQTGALFRQESNGLSAVVKTEGTVLRIFVKGENDLHRPHTYLNTIRDTLVAIHRDMGLTEPECFVVYKKNGKSERFLYEMLLGSLESGLPAVYSQMMRQAVPIVDILDQSDREVERKKKQLLADVAAACVRMQSKKICWNASEDDRNTELRDMLWSMMYRVADQSFAGVGAGGQRSGELDLLILNEQNLPWMVCEALNIKGNTPSQVKNWDDHLNKLLFNYNSVGVQDLILISYVNATADEFRNYWTTYSEHMRWYDPPEVLRRDGTYEVQQPTLEQYNCLHVARCTYDRGGMPTTVHHYFLRLGL